MNERWTLSDRSDNRVTEGQSYRDLYCLLRFLRDQGAEHAYWVHVYDDDGCPIRYLPKEVLR